MTQERKIKGRVAEASVLKHFVSLGYDVFTGYTDNNKHDLLVFDGTKILRVFVRYTSSGTNSSWSISLTNVYRSKSGNVVRHFEPDHFDLIAAYVGPEDRVVVLDAGIPNTSVLHIPKIDPKPRATSEKTTTISKPLKDLCECGASKGVRAKRCSSCAPKFREPSGSYKIKWPTSEELSMMVQESNYSATARKLGVSDNAVRKRLSQSGLER